MINRVKVLYKRGGILAAILMSCMVFTTQPVCAGEAEQTGEIHLKYTPVQEAQFWVYRVGDITDSWEFELTGEFKEFQMDLNALDTESMAAAAQTLASYVKADRIEADHSGRTDMNGDLYFSGLAKGVYLIDGESIIHEGVRYDPVPVLVTVPSMNEAGEWVYETEVETKYETFIPTGEKKEYRIVKYWSNDGDGSVRPKDITVEILKDGERHSVQTLSEENDWSYVWKTEDDGSVWQVVERNIPEGYTVMVEKNQTAFMISNTYREEGKEPPKTGDGTALLYTAILLFLSGLILIIAGLTIWRRKRDAKQVHQR